MFYFVMLNDRYALIEKSPLNVIHRSDSSIRVYIHEFSDILYNKDPTFMDKCLHGGFPGIPPPYTSTITI